MGYIGKNNPLILTIYPNFLGHPTSLVQESYIKKSRFKLACETKLLCVSIVFACSPPTKKNNIFAPKNGWLEYYFPIGEAYFQVLC